VSLLPTARLAKWCVFAAATFILVGIGFIKAAAWVDVIVLGAVPIGIGFVCGFCAHKLNPRIVQRFLDD
jgi:hypothetical protein